MIHRSKVASPFFSNSEKLRGKSKSLNTLKNDYEKSEKRLIKATYTGKESNIKKAMRTHHYYEYSLLYRKMIDSRKK